MSRKWLSGVGGFCSRIASSRIGSDSAHLRLTFSAPCASTTSGPKSTFSDRVSLTDEIINAAPLAAPSLVPPVVQPSPAEAPPRLLSDQQPQNLSTPQHKSSSATPEKSELHPAVPLTTRAHNDQGSCRLAPVTAASSLRRAPCSSGKSKRKRHRSADSPGRSSTLVQLEICNSLRLVSNVLLSFNI